LVEVKRFITYFSTCLYVTILWNPNSVVSKANTRGASSNERAVERGLPGPYKM